ncbi:MAG: hypothetical protein KDB14_12755 [Planctomycetales bacterium]|nr:hypothetical protein [Planctomycetales bacterium]
MPNRTLQHGGAAIAITGWAGQTLSLLAIMWPNALALKVDFVAAWCFAALFTIVLGIGLAMFAMSRGHTAAFGVLALSNIVGLMTIGALPDLMGDPADERIEFACPYCGERTMLSLEHAGKRGRCRACGEWIEVPGMLSQADLPRSHENEADEETAPPRDRDQV